MRFRFCGDLDCPTWVLAEMQTLSNLPTSRIKYLVGQILSYCLEGSFDYEKVTKIVDDSADGKSELKGAVAAVHFIITNAAKHDLDESSLVQEIQQLGLPRENANAIGRHYRESKESLRTQLADESYRLSQLIDVEWRVDAVFASSSSSSSSPPPTIMGEKGPPVSGEGDDDADAVVHLCLCIDTCPQVRGGEHREGRWQDLAFELSPEKLDVLIHELTQAQTLLHALDLDSS